MIKRSIEPQVINSLNDGFVTILYGARQLGKTTLAKHILANEPNGLYLNADDPAVIARLQNQPLSSLSSAIGSASMVVIDEAQRIENIGITAKLIHDALPEKKLLLTGSSSLELANKIKEPLTGRAQEFQLFPLSIKEVSNNVIEADGFLDRLIVYGGYPGLWKLDEPTAANRARSIANQYLYRDAFSLDTVYDRTVIDSLLVLLAHQIGNEVSYSELASSLEVSKETVMRYIDLLEKAFIILRQRQYRKNQRVQIGRLRKIYFYDLGMRNALIDNFQPVEIRQDIGALWENLCVLERMKKNQKENNHAKYYYWRSRDKQEVDLVEETGKQTIAFECKWGKAPKFPGGFTKQYPNIPTIGINKENYWDYL